MSGARDLSRLPWPDIATAVDAGVLAVLPIGACEQHGHHLPLSTDTDLARGVSQRTAAGLSALAEVWCVCASQPLASPLASALSVTAQHRA